MGGIQLICKICLANPLRTINISLTKNNRFKEAKRFW